MAEQIDTAKRLVRDLEQHGIDRDGAIEAVVTLGGCV